MPRKLSTPSSLVPRTAPLSVCTTGDAAALGAACSVAVVLCEAHAGSAQNANVTPKAVVTSNNIRFLGPIARSLELAEGTPVQRQARIRLRWLPPRKCSPLSKAQAGAPVTS